MKGWTLDQIPWQDFDPSKVDQGILEAVKAACLVEFNGGDYAHYLHAVFHDDPEFQAAATQWASEEVRHGRALAKWAMIADPTFDFEGSFAKFREGCQLPVSTKRSVRGSRAGELVARCVVEAGTSSFYSSLSDATHEPVLKQVCRLIAADEFRHYKLFYDNLKRYCAVERTSTWRRALVALGRMVESEDDELAFAYYCGNNVSGPFDRRQNTRAYARRAYRYYGYGHLDRGIGMTFKAAGMRPNSRVKGFLSRLVWRFMVFRRRRLDAAAA